MKKQKTKGADTRFRITQTAAQAFDERGYFGTGMNDIILRSGAPKGSMYFHFPGGKEEVATTAIRQVSEEITSLLKQGLGHEVELDRAIGMIFSYFRQRLIIGEFKCGCPISTTGLEFSGTNSPVLDACNEAYSSWMAVLEHHLLQSLPQPMASELTNTIFYLVQGSLLVARVSGDISHLDNAEKHCVSLLAAAGAPSFNKTNAIDEPIISK